MRNVQIGKDSFNQVAYTLFPKPLKTYFFPPDLRSLLRVCDVLV